MVKESIGGYGMGYRLSMLFSAFVRLLFLVVLFPLHGRGGGAIRGRHLFENGCRFCAGACITYLG